ncbi:MAG: nucleotidyltransferase domain-containing protein [Gemmatimonadaceae bacterium]
MSVSRPAYGLLLACATWDASNGELDMVRARAAAAVDWTEWLELARWHRLIPHAQRVLGAARAPSPPDCAGRVMQETVTIAARALARTQQLAQLLRALDEDGVRALPFKGPALSLAAYGELGVRDSVDLDVVVRPDDIERARETLVRAGYAPASAMSPAQERALQRSFGHFVYSPRDAGVPVELHWRFAAPRYPWSIPAEEVFARAIRIELAGFAALSPDNADQLLLQAMHGARHQWERLEWLVAFAQLLTRVGADEELLIERANANGSARALSLALRLAHDVLGAPLSARLAALADEDRTAARAAQVVRALEAGVVSTGQPYRFNMGMMDHASDRARYIALSVLAPTPREWELVRLPAWLVVLYYPIRLLRVLALQPVRLARAAAHRLRAPAVRR